MDIFHSQHLKEIFDASDSKCISIYLPAFVSGREVRQTPIRFRNLLNKALEEWEKRGWDKEEIETQLKEIGDWNETTDSSQYQAPGLCLFIAPGFFRFYRLPLHFKEQVEVSNRFYIQPLLPILYKDRNFYVLTLDLHNIKLFRANEQEIDEMELEGVTTSFQDFMGQFDEEKQVQYHTNTSNPSSGAPGLIFHGQGSAGDETTRKHQIQQFFQTLNRELKPYLGEEKIPIVLAGTDYLLPMFRDISDFEPIVKEGIEGNMEQTQPKQLNEKALNILKPIWEKEKEKSKERFEYSKSKGIGSNDVLEVAQKAHQGKVEELLLGPNNQYWGRIRQEDGMLEKVTNPTQDSFDLIDYAALKTLIHRGVVYSFEDALPYQSTEVAAILRK